MEGEGAASGASGVTPEVLALSKVVSRLRAEVVDLESGASRLAVLERAKGVVMARAGVSAEAAYQLLLERAEESRRSLLEECWITLGRLGTGNGAAPVGSAGSDALLPREPAQSAFSARRYVVGDDRSAAQRALLARLAQSLAEARTGDDVARLLRSALKDAEYVDAVMIYAAAAGSLRLIGSAGVDGELAEQWSHVPPLSGIAAHEVIGAQEAVWLEDLAEDIAGHRLIGDPPDRWPSRAWLPVPASAPMTTVIGFLRSVAGPFDARTRTLLRRAVRLCGGPLSGDGAPREVKGSDEGVTTVQAVFDALSGPAVLLTPLRSDSGEVEDYRIDAASPEAVDVVGRRGTELVGRRILETYPTVAGTAVWEGYLSTLVTGTAFVSEPFAYEEVNAGVPRQSVYSVRSSRFEGRLVVSWIRHDASEREARLLSKVQRLGNLGWASWNLITDVITWSDQVYIIFGRDPALGPMRLEELPEHLAAEDLPALGAGVQRLLGDGAPIDQTFRITTAYGLRHLRIVAEAERDADGAPVEVHGVFQDLSVLKDAELALRDSERHNLLQRGMLKAERALGARLQEALLPVSAQSLDLAGLCVDVAYLPADRGLNVGGDWYSAIELPDECALFVVGDVAGHGMPAVGTMAQLRFTAKGMAVTGSPPPDVLSRLNALLLHPASNEQGATATMIMGRYRPSDQCLTWARAGHLPPLLIRGGSAEFLVQPDGCLLGATHDARYGQSTVVLQPGDHLLLYTDGLVEEPAEDIETGLHRLADKAARLVEQGGHHSLARRLADLGQDRRDDICVLDLHLPDDRS
ncbi:phosphatase [Streptomyces sp. CB02009]|uniref:SpoIIE family protein phosphatase n=1 Tax=Streptomyces sp. CB02009 TaxID=1703938 RepID=UPI000938DB2C|nr:SpoIIE family protein phosphatase [Streptomyces sp. CB02009]OKJ63844.1 phosphatase [Streptomyces sp. CB02009]